MDGMEAAAPGYRLLGYVALGQELGIEADSAMKLAKRRGWRRSPGNDGRVLVHVPEAELADILAEKARRSQDAEVEEGKTSPAPSSQDTAALAALRRDLEEARTSRARAEGEAAGLRASLDRLEADAVRLRQEVAQARQEARDNALGAAEAVRLREDLERERAALTRLRSRGFLDRLMGRE